MTYIKKISDDKVLFIAFILALLSSFVNVPKLTYIDFRVIITLFNLMIIIKALEDINLLDVVAISILKKLKSERLIILFLALLTFFFSMLVTNDVALLTFVPLSIVISKKIKINICETIIIQTISANIGSSLTPMGNPQNLFIYYFYNLSTRQFFSIILPISSIGLLIIVVNTLKFNKNKINLKFNDEVIKDHKKFIIYLFLFLIVLLSVFKIFDYLLINVLLIVSISIIDVKLFKKIDYSLLLTFIFFFIFIGNIQQIDFIKDVMNNILSNKFNVYFVSIIFSQVISNVPATFLLSSFTSNYKPLLLGVNIGGLGTLVASLASLISYKLYKKEYKEDNYIFKFTVYNLIYLSILTLIGFVILVS